jgi:hypothetical protein
LPDGIYSNQKFPIWKNFGSSNGRCWYILWPFALFYGRLVYIFCGHLVYSMVIWYIFPILVSCTEKNLATLAGNRVTR